MLSWLIYVLRVPTERLPPAIWVRQIVVEERFGMVRR